MNSNTRALTVEITRFVDGNFPGWVECEFTDAEGRKHRIVDKYLVFSDEILDDSSDYPMPGFARCEILNLSRDENDDELARITILRPDAMESTEGLTEFVVPSSILQPDPWPPS